MQDDSGVTFMRKPRGKKLSFIVGGPSLSEVVTYLRGGKDVVFVWCHDSGVQVEFCVIPEDKTVVKFTL